MKRWTIGLVGLPNVGKSTFFETLTNKEVLIANYPFSTIDPNIGLLDVYDERVLELKDFFQSNKVTYNNFELVDVAGIVRGASQKIGLGGEFLSHIRTLDMICHVVRCFKDSNILHVETKIDPTRDFAIIQLEFILADIQQVEKRLEKVNRFLKKGNTKELIEELELLEKINESLKQEIPISQLNLTTKEKLIIKNHNFLTNKPSMIIANYDGADDREVEKLKSSYKNVTIFPMPIKLENDFKTFSEEEKRELGWKSFDKNRFFQIIKNSLELKTFFTAGKSESRSWMIEESATAIECSGLIHSDIQNRFIKAEIYNFQEIKNPNFNLKNSKKESAPYIVKEGDVCNFIFNK